MIANLVSTIIPVFNRPVQLAVAVGSVVAQNYSPIEIILVDDGSTDDTFAVAQAFERQHPGLVRAFTKSNGGPGLAREYGRTHARGEFIQYLDSDDVLLPGKFRSQVEALRREPCAGVAYGITLFRATDGSLGAEPHKLTGERIETMFPRFLTGRWWETATPLYRSAVCDAAGPWSNLCLEEDWEYDCRVASLGTRLAFCPVAVSEHRDHSGGRLSRGDNCDPIRNRQRARSHELIYGHAVRAGLVGSKEMHTFARALFLLSRQCGASGLATDSRMLFGLAKAASSTDYRQQIEFGIYRLGTRIVGWSAMGRLGNVLDRVR